MANGAEIRMICGLIDDMREDVGRSRALLDAENIWAASSDEHTLDNLRLTLNQLHAPNRLGSGVRPAEEDRPDCARYRLAYGSRAA